MISGRLSGRVLAVGVQQHHEVHAVLERHRVRGLLVAAVAEVLGVPQDDRPGRVGAGWPTPVPYSKVRSLLASSQMMISSIRLRKSSGIRSSVSRSVDSALYATTTMPILGSDGRMCFSLARIGNGYEG